MRRTLARIERLEQFVAEAASRPVPVEKPPWTEELEAEAFRIFCELEADARAKRPNFDEEMARLNEGLLLTDDDDVP